MTAAATQVIIRHLSGSKTNQLEQFNLEGLSEITLGRDPSSRIAFDLQRDDSVSRKHAVIRVKNEKEVYFRLADLNSSNGTFLNGERISGEVELLPDDLVELGSGGPKFVFDVQPRPANLPARTRQMAAISAIEAAATRVVGSTEVPETTEVAAFSDSSQQTAARDPSAMAKVPVGKATILRMLTEERGKTRQVWIAAIAAVVLLAIVGGGALYWHGQSVANQLAQQLAQQQAVAEANKRQAEANLQQEMGITPEKIKQLGESTVYIRNQWQLYDRATNRPIYQKMANVDGEWLPCYVRMDDGSLVRWLTLDNDKDNNYEQIGGNEIGSGFVIGSQGAILTSKATVASWTSTYEDFSNKDGARGAIFNFRDAGGRYPAKGPIDVDSLTGWVPESGGWIFEAGRPYPISPDTREFFGRNEALTVQFPGTRISINASLLRTSIDAGVAELKIDVGEPLTSLELADDDKVQVGEKIILLGYSVVSNKTRAVQETNEGGQTRRQDIYIPEPTVTEGVVSLLPTKSDRQANADVRTYDTAGNNYQLDIYAGPGSYGGPVLNTSGKVIGLISLLSTSAQHVAFAVPISYVHELLQPQRNAQ
jgi:S1-C subfamily serine protease